MNKSLSDAANVAASGAVSQSPRDLTITCAWEDVLGNGLDFNFRLLQQLANLQAAGHRVIITENTDEAIIRDMLFLAPEFAQEKGYDLGALPPFEFISKADLKQISDAGRIKVDVAIDCEDISTQTRRLRIDGEWRTQRMDYVQPTHEIRVHRNFSTTPVSMDQLAAFVNGVAKGNDDGGYKPPAPH